MSKKKRLQGKGAIELIEETTCLIRHLPARVLALYYTGSLPFILAFLYFWADMSRSPLASRRNAESAFIMALLFIWMKCWQTVFAGELRTIISGEIREGWNVRRVVRMIAEQTFFQPAAFIILPVALIITLPFGWAYAFFQNISILGNGKSRGMNELYRKALRHATYFPGQNHFAILILSLFSFFVLCNIGTVLYLFPHMMNSFLGVDSLFARAGWSMVNTTIIAITLSMTYLIVDPFVKGVYVLRTFYGESLRTGADLRADMKRFTPASKKMAIFLLIFSIGSSSGPATQAFSKELTGARTTSRQKVISAKKLDSSISEVIKQREYQWRMPRVKVKEEESKGFLASFLEDTMETISTWLGDLSDWIEKMLDWFMPDSTHKKADPQKSMPSVHYLIYLLLCIVTSVLAISGWRKLKSQRNLSLKPDETIKAQAPDLSSEDISADELPANRWLEMGRKFMEEGNLRFALRAFYLASLSHLATQNMISIAAFKSNRDYENELKRRAHSLPDLVSAFSFNVKTFEEIWYGMHDVTNELVKGFEVNQKRIMASNES
ncbi:MAG: hypothetical protein IME96_06365 [Proteobacteria bacterium]|nr:hypothetical protein [Pseudomonadota bacterium]